MSIQWSSDTTIGDLLDALSVERPDAIVRPGVSCPHSYRGYYDEAAVKLTEACTVEDASTPLWSATWGCTGIPYGLPEISPE